MLPTGTFLSSASVSSVVEVRNLHHEVGLDMGIIFMYNMSIWGGSWGPGCCRRARFRRRRRRRRSYRSGTFTAKSGLACPLIWYIICPCRSNRFKMVQQLDYVSPSNSRAFLRKQAKKASVVCIHASKNKKWHLCILSWI